MTGPVRVSEEVTAALADGAAVVALESTLLAHGLPAPRDRAAADELEQAVRARGAVPATVAVLDGRARVGLSSAELDRVCSGGRRTGRGPARPAAGGEHGAGDRARDHRQGRHPGPAGAFPRGQRWCQPAHEPGAGPGERRAGRRGGGGARARREGGR